MAQVMPHDRDDETGQYLPEYPPEEALAAIREVGGRTATTEVAEHLGSTREAAYMILARLEERGEVRSEMVGANRMWEIVEVEEE